jgi:phosphate-selective porin O/P
VTIHSGVRQSFGTWRASVLAALLCAFTVTFPRLTPAQTPPPIPSEPVPAAAAPAPEKPSHFFDHIGVRGYTQFRYNQLAATNERLINLQGDRSVGQDAGLLIRRARLVLFGDLHPQVSMYLQTDFAATAGDTIHIGQIRDWYFDLALDPARELRFRVGQSKVPYGFENLQSSQNRLPMDRSDALNSGMPGERDLGVFFYYAPAAIRKRFKLLTDTGLKGSGDYGVVGIGFYEGQSINQLDLNTNKHVVARLTYPFQFGPQFLELGVSGYTGKFVVRTDPGILAPPDGVRDARAALSFTLYPQPFGLQAEYTLGTGPELTGATTLVDAEGEETNSGVVSRKTLHGGYALASLKLDTFIPYVRVMNYEGGKKQERNAPRYTVRELEAGVEWQLIQPVEVTAAWTLARRTDGGRFPYEPETGSLVRLQLQINY